MGVGKLLDGTESRPPQNVNAQRQWDERAREVLKVIIGSCSLTYQELCTEFAENLDFTSTVLKNFHPTQFDPKSQKFQDIVNKLKHFQVQLASTEDKLTDRNLLLQLVHSLPQNDSYWKIQGTHVLTNKLSLEDAILHLQSCEELSVDKTPAQANNVRNTGASRGKRGIIKGRGKRRFGNVPHDREKKGESLRKGNYGKSRGKSGRFQGRDFDADQCKWY
ncbi:hypothetical protein K3495_g15271 [Podosphaera aphanis]|nr:hypothetical protein K3495_g15271 [Podosphaera aphanis]